MQRLLLALERPLRFNYVTTSQLKVSKWLQLKLWNSGFLAILLHALFKVHYEAILWPDVGPLRTRSGPSGSATDLKRVCHLNFQNGLHLTQYGHQRTPLRTLKFNRTRYGFDTGLIKSVPERWMSPLDFKTKVCAEPVFDFDKVRRGLIFLLWAAQKSYFVDIFTSKHSIV